VVVAPFPCLLKVSNVMHKAKEPKKMNSATPVATPAIPVKPSAPNINAMTRKVSA